MGDPFYPWDMRDWPLSHINPAYKAAPLVMDSGAASGVIGWAEAFDKWRNDPRFYECNSHLQHARLNFEAGWRAALAAARTSDKVAAQWDAQYRGEGK